MVIKKSVEIVWEWVCIYKYVGECVVYMYRGGLGSQMTRTKRKEWVVRMYSYQYRQFILEIWLWKPGKQEFFRCGFVYCTNVSTPSGFPVGWLTSQHLLSLLGSRALAPSTYWWFYLNVLLTSQNLHEQVIQVNHVFNT